MSIQHPATPSPIVHSLAPRASGTLDRLARSVLETRLSTLRRGTLLIEDEGHRMRFGTDAPGELAARLHVRDPRAYGFTLLGGSVGAGEAYVNGWWDSPDVTAVCRLFARNVHALQSLDSGWSRLSAPALKAAHALNKNTRSGSARNISAHYDLGNDLFQLFLDETLTYSSGVFERESASMADASRAKLDRACRKLRLSAADHVLEIGTGWGSFALHAAEHYGCRVTTTTISKNQFELARERVAAAGLSDRITVLLEDYRDLHGRYDKLASIEMIEAVGHHYLDQFFRKTSDLLEPDGAMLLQAITIKEQLYERSRDEVDFVKKYIFPGSCLLSASAISSAVARVTDLNVFHVEELGPHYAETLRRWRARFEENAGRIRALGYDERFMRLWRYYLCYCEASFEERYTGLAQWLLTKPDCRRAPIAPVID